MNATGADRVDLISRAVSINAGIYANQLNVVAGANQVDYNTLQTKPITGDVNTPQIQIDIGKLGGMYAQKIYMVGTEKGVGVNSQGVISSTGDLDINSEGKVTLFQASIGGNITVMAKDQVISQSNLYAQGNTIINTQTDFQNTGILASGQQTKLIAQNISSIGSLGSGITSDGNVGNTGDLILNANGTVITRGQNIVAGNLSIKGTGIDLSNSKTTAGQLDLMATNITNQNGQITQTGIGDTSIIASNFLDNDGGQIGSNGTNMKLQASSVLNSQGQIQHAGTGTLTIHTTSDMVNAKGKIITNGQGSFITQNLDNTQGTITAQKQINVTVLADVTNQQGIVMSGDAVSITAQTLENQGGNIASQGNLSITATNGIDSNVTSGNIQNNEIISSGGNLSLKSSGRILLLGSTSAKGNINVNADGGVNNYGTIYGKGDTTISTQGTLANNGAIVAGQNMTLSGRNIKSTGTLGAGIQADGSVGTTGDLIMDTSGEVSTNGQNTAANNLTVKAADINLSASRTYAGNNANLTATVGDISNEGGSVQAKGVLTLTAKTAINNGKGANGTASTMQADGISINATSINNVGSSIVQTGIDDTAITVVNNINNMGGTIATNGKTFNLTADTITNSQGTIIHVGKDTLNITAGASITNINSGTIQTNGSINLKTRDLNNTKGRITALQGIGITGNTVINDQGIIATGGSMTIGLQKALSNQGGMLETGAALNINAQTVSNQGGSITSLDSSGMTVNVVQSIDNTSGTIGGNGDVNLTAQTLTNATGKVLSQKNLMAAVSQNINNTGGKIAAQQNVTLGSIGTILTNASQGNIEAGNNLSAQANTLNNVGGTMAANQDLNLNTTSITGMGSVVAGQDFNFNQNGDFIYQGDANIKANRDINITTGNFTNLNNLSAVRKLNINANNVINTAGVNLTGGAGLSITAKGNISNSGTMQGDIGDITAQNITNTGSIFGSNLTMTAGTIANNGNNAVIATTQKTNLYAQTSLENKDGANIYSMGDINIAGGQNQDINGKYIDWSGSVLNQSATIQADNDVQIYANDITNKKREFVTGQTVVSQTSYGSPGQLISSSYDYLHNADSATYLTGQSVAETTVIKDSPEGKILAGKNITLNVNNGTNNLSWILAAGSLNLSANATVNNIAVGRTQSITKYFKEYDHWTYEVTFLDHFDEVVTMISYIEVAGLPPIPVISTQLTPVYRTETRDQFDSKDLPSSTTTGALSSYTSLFGGGQSVNIQAHDVNNIIVAPGNTPVNKVNGPTSSGQPQGVATIPTSGNTSSQIANLTSDMQTSLPSGQKLSNVSVQQTISNNTITLPTNGMFKIHKESTSHYLVETNPLFANYKKFISSDYMLNSLGLDPAKTMKQIGDGFYEQKLVREQVSELTGRYFLKGYSSAEEQFKALMDNGTTYAKEFNLQVGINLTKEQMERLTSDMVWLVEKDVDGQKVLVPTVYLAHTRSYDLKDNGALIAADTIQITTTGDTVSNGVIKANNGLQISAADIINRNGAITGGQVNLLANRNLTIDGGIVSAGSDITLKAGQNLEIGSIANTQRIAIPFDVIQKTTNVVSSIQAGGNVTLSAGQDATLRGAQITAGKDLNLNAYGNINITNVKDNVTEEKHSGYKNKDYSITKTDDETVIGTTLQGGNQVTIGAGHLLGSTTINPNGGNINIEGSYINSNKGKVDISADKDVIIKEVTEKHESLIVTHKEDSGFFSTTTTDTMDHSLINQVKGSAISGDAVTVKSGKDLTIQGSSIVGTKDVTLTATNKVNIISAKETGKDEHFKEEKTSGLFSGGGLGFTIGSKSEKTTNNEQTLAEVGSTIGSIKGNISITAGDKVNSAGTTFIADKNLNITGKDVTIDNTINTVDSQYKYEFKQTGLSVSLGGGIVGAATSVYNNVNRSTQVQDDRLKALYDYKALEEAKKLGDYKGNLGSGLGISVSFGSTQMTSEQTSHTETVNTSNVDVGGNVNLTATDGDLNLKGTKINAVDVTLDAKKNINIEGADNKQQTTSNTSSSSWALGASVDLSTKGVGYFGNFNSAKGKENGNSTNNVGSVIDASRTLTLKSGNDTNIDGSKVKGDKVVADIKGDLNIASKQDTDNYTAKNESSGFGFSTQQVDGKPLPAGTAGPINQVTNVGLTGSYNKGKTDSNYASVTDQAGIFAGKDGFKITVGKNTDLKGAVIASEAEAIKNALKTGTLTFVNMENRAKYNSSSTGYNLNTNPDAKYNEQGLTPIASMPVSGDANSTTKSVISPGTITITGNQTQDLSGLSRDTTNSLDTLGKIFDKQTAQERKELAGLFGEMAFEEIHKLSDKNGWDEGSPQKIALHTLVGGIMSDLTGNGFMVGAKGAAFNEAIQNELSKITDPALRQWASYIISSAVTGTVGRMVALYGTKYNNESWIQHQKDMDIRKASLDMERRDKFEQLDSDYNVWNDLHAKGEITDQAYEYLKEQYGKQYNQIHEATDMNGSISWDTLGGLVTGSFGIPGMILGEVAFDTGTAHASSIGEQEVANLMQDSNFLEKFMNYGTRAKQHVYVLFDETTKEIKYVGRSVDPDQRYNQHMNGDDEAKKGLKMRVVTEESGAVSFAEGRGIEQYVHEQLTAAKLLNGEEKLINQIRPVNVDKPWGQFLRNLGEKAFERLKLRL